MFGRLRSSATADTSAAAHAFIARGYVQKQAAGRELVQAIRQAVSAGTGPPEPTWAPPHSRDAEF
jgi:DNA-binding NarL/FixJ family response regulator